MTVGWKTTASVAFLITAAAPMAARASDPIPSNYQLLETIVVPPDGSVVASTTILTSGVAYWLKVSGTDPGAGDAEYDPAGNDRCMTGTDQLDVGVVISPGISGSAPALVIDKLPFWGVFDPSHVYTSQVTGRGNTLLVSYRDCVSGDNVGGLTLQLFGPGSTARPGCDVVFTHQTFVDGQPVIPFLIRLANNDSQPVTVEFKLWLRLPGLGAASLVNVGADSMVQLPPHFHPDFTNVTLFTVTPAFPRGTYELACVLSDPITGEIFNRRVDRFSVR
jgi:hypothetical protein